MKVTLDLDSTETSVGQMENQVTYTQSNPLFEMSLSRSDLHSFQPDGEYYSKKFETFWSK